MQEAVVMGKVGTRDWWPGRVKHDGTSEDRLRSLGTLFSGMKR